MHFLRVLITAFSCCAFSVFGLAAAGGIEARPAPSPAQGGTPAPAVKVLGTVKTTSGNSLTLLSDTKTETTVMVQDSTRIVRTAPGQTDLKNATPIALADVQTGDRILVRGKMAEDGNSLAATSIIVMKGTDISEHQQREREDWQKRGVGGLVTESSASAGTVTISNTVAGVKKSTVVHVSPQTVIRRYSPDSVKFDDAKPGTLDQIKPGNQLRARGTRSADGGDFTAEEIVSGSFRNIAGLVKEVDTAKGTLTVSDLLTKKPVTVKISADSQLKKIPPMVAQRIAARLKGAPAGGANQAAGAPPVGPGAAMQGPPGGQPSAAPAGAEAGGGRAGGGADMQQLLNRMPDATLPEIQKSDAVMLVSTEGSASSDPTAIILLSGVEAILTASPKGGAMLMSPWSLGSSISDAMAQ